MSSYLYSNMIQVKMPGNSDISPGGLLNLEIVDIQKILAKITNIRTVPQIFIAGRSVGGGDDIERLHNKKKLIPMMKKAGIECKDK